MRRLKLFGCPTVTDEVALHIAEYLRSANSETAPFELHLSDCSLTSTGFSALISAIEENDAFPVTNPETNKKTPLYMRLENNYIEEAMIKEKVDANVIKIFIKDWGRRIDGLNGEEKVYFLKKHHQLGFQQKQGSPPPPEEVPPNRKDVFESWKQPLWQPNWQPTWQPSWQQPQWQQLPKWQPQWQQSKPAVSSTQRVVVPNLFQGKPVRTIPVPKGKAGTKGKPAWAAPALGNVVKPTMPVQAATLVKPTWSAGAQQAAPQVPQKQSWQQQQTTSWKGWAGKATGKGAGKAAGKARAADRSRTPVVRQPTQPTQPKVPPPGAKQGLPHPWQEQFSEEFGINYYWNPETQESVWEKPEA